MVGIVLVSHSQALAESAVELTKMMAPNARTAAAGGLEDGTFGTSYDRIREAVLSVYSEDGVVILMDMGSAVMTAEMVVEELEGKRVVLADCPFIEGAVAVTVSAEGGDSLEAVLAAAQDAAAAKKLEG